MADPKSLDDIVRDLLGSQLLTIVRLQAALAQAEARIAELEAQQPKEKEPTP